MSEQINSLIVTSPRDIDEMTEWVTVVFDPKNFEPVIIHQPEQPGVAVDSSQDFQGFINVHREPLASLADFKVAIEAIKAILQANPRKNVNRESLLDPLKCDTIET